MFLSYPVAELSSWTFRGNRKNLTRISEWDSLETLQVTLGPVGQEDYSRHDGEMGAAIHDSFGPNGEY